MASLTRLDETYFTEWRSNSDTHCEDDSLAHKSHTLDADQPPILTQADLDAAFSSGMKIGEVKARNALQADACTQQKDHTIQIWEMITTSLQEQYLPMLATIRARETEQVNACIAALTTIFQEHLPCHLIKKTRALLSVTSNCQGTDDKICIQLNETDLCAVQSELADLMTKEQQETNFSFAADENIQPGSCKISWQGGHVTYNPHSVFHETLAQLRTFLDQPMEATSDD